ncbi:conserved MORN repeat-containing protein [Lausannevirus]|uniref:YwqK-like antitoxin protein n=2 Tax=Lausannevirus TaxID=999883 RepID=A0A0N9PUP9_9VIRU|nr:conserved MORN repeat-containing protein [Lausannevirus]AEA07215.1 conserved MORN repeat-containing protein [Lausannevirus]ALH07027.1 YwqK-like antitoxin protein [Port-miou virus]
MQSQKKIISDEPLCVQKVERWQEYDFSGNLRHHKRIVRYRNGKKHGNLDLFIGGKIQISTPYVEGKRHGKERTWFPNGTLASFTMYVDGKEHGVHKTFDIDGSLAWWLKYNRGEVFDGEENWGNNRENVRDNER